MIRPLALSLVAGLALLTASVCGADETFPVVHNEPITVRILGGKDGQPLAHYHLLLIAGYDQSDIHDQLYRQEALTDSLGRVRLSKQLANLPWIQVWVNKKPLCQASPRGASYSVELIRRDGFSAPNRCGMATVDDAPGVFNVFVKSKPNHIPVVVSTASAPAHLPVSITAPVTLPAVETPARKPVQAEVASPTPQPPAAAVAAPLPATPAPAPVEVALKAAPPVQAATPAPAVEPARDSASIPAKAEAHSPVRQVDARPATRRATPPAHRAKPVLASCQVRRPYAKAASTSARRANRPARTTSVALNATRKPKPAAGVRQAAAKPGNPKAPPRQE